MAEAGFVSASSAMISRYTLRVEDCP